MEYVNQTLHEQFSRVHVLMDNVKDAGVQRLKHVGTLREVLVDSLQRLPPLDTRELAKKSLPLLLVMLVLLNYTSDVWASGGNGTDHVSDRSSPLIEDDATNTDDLSAELSLTVTDCIEDKAPRQINQCIRAFDLEQASEHTQHIKGRPRKSNINVRRLPTAFSERLDILQQNDDVDIVGSFLAPDGYVWYIIDPGDGEEGFVRADLIVVDARDDKVSEVLKPQDITFASGAVGYKMETEGTRGVFLEAKGHKQLLPLSCEVAALANALTTFIPDMSAIELERILLKHIKYGSFGADPDKVFVGRINGSQSANPGGAYWGYGMYSRALRDVFLRAGDDIRPKISSNYSLEPETRKFNNRTEWQGYIMSQIDQGLPVVVWGVINLHRGSPLGVHYIDKSKGYIGGEHAVAIVGYFVEEDKDGNEVIYFITADPHKPLGKELITTINPVFHMEALGYQTFSWKAVKASEQVQQKSDIGKSDKIPERREKLSKIAGDYGRRDKRPQAPFIKKKGKQYWR